VRYLARLPIARSQGGIKRRRLFVGKFASVDGERLHAGKLAAKQRKGHKVFACLENHFTLPCLPIPFDGGRGNVDSKLKDKNFRLVSRLLDWFSLNARDLPWRRTHDPYAIWVSEIMISDTY
jgi:hypothetical protein